MPTREKLLTEIVPALLIPPAKVVTSLTSMPLAPAAILPLAALRKPPQKIELLPGYGRRGIAGTRIFDFPQKLRAIRGPILEQSFLGGDAIAVWSAPLGPIHAGNRQDGRDTEGADERRHGQQPREWERE